MQDSRGRKRPQTIPPIVSLLLAGLAVAFRLDAAETNRPASWAQPVKLDGVPNLYRVNSNLYRSAQPTAEGMRNLTNLGIVVQGWTKKEA